MVRAANTKLKLKACLVVVVHLLLVIVHAAAHQSLKVDPSASQLTFIVVTIIAAPVFAGLLLWKLENAGGVILTISMAAALAFGVYNHFVGHSIDDVTEVAHLQPVVWSLLFRMSAVGLAISEALGTLAGLWLVTMRRPKLESYAA